MTVLHVTQGVGVGEGTFPPAGGGRWCGVDLENEVLLKALVAIFEIYLYFLIYVFVFVLLAATAILVWHNNWYIRLTIS